MSRSKEIKMTRFDARLTETQKALFERAARILGFRSLSEFIIQTVQAKALTIVEEHDQTLASEKDKRVFFDALATNKGPNKKLKDAADRYKSASRK